MIINKHTIKAENIITLIILIVGIATVVILLLLMFSLDSKMLAKSKRQDNDNKITTFLSEKKTEKEIEYSNFEYGFGFSLPHSWIGFAELPSQWEGYAFDVQEERIVERGPMVTLRHPLWTSETPRQDIPIMIFTNDQWIALQESKFHIDVAPTNPYELGRSNDYIFALPARFDYSQLEGVEEVSDIIRSKPLQIY